jgi:hypothetical protein
MESSMLVISPVSMGGRENHKRAWRLVLSFAALVCLVGAAVALVVSRHGGSSGPVRTELFGPWNPMTAHVHQPQMSMRATKAMYSLWQQAKWAKLFKGDNQHDALVQPVNGATPHYVRELELAANGAPKARTQALDYMESKPRSDHRHPADLDVYQTYEYYPKPEGQGVTDYDGNRLWTEMQRNYRAQHPSATTYPAVPVVFVEDSEGGHPVANPLSQPVEDIYQGMGYEDNMQPPYGMGMMPEKSAKERQSRHSTMQLSPKEGFAEMKREDEREEEQRHGPESSAHSYRNPDWREHYVPQMNSDHKTFMATPSVAKPRLVRGDSWQQRAGGEDGDEEEGSTEHEKRKLAQQRDKLNAMQENILKEQEKLDHELKETKEEKATLKKSAEAQAAKLQSPAETPAEQALLKWERSHGVDDKNAYHGVKGGSAAERRAHNRAEQQATAAQKLRAEQQARLKAGEKQELMLTGPAKKMVAAGGDTPGETHALVEEISQLKEVIKDMGHRQDQMAKKDASLKGEIGQLVAQEKQELSSFSGRLHSDNEFSAKLESVREQERAQLVHENRLERKIALVEERDAEEKDELRRERAAGVQHLAEQEHKARAEQAAKAKQAQRAQATAAERLKEQEAVEHAALERRIKAEEEKEHAKMQSQAKPKMEQLTNVRLVEEARKVEKQEEVVRQAGAARQKGIERSALMKENARMNAQMRMEMKAQKRLDVAEGGTKIARPVKEVEQADKAKKAEALKVKSGAKVDEEVRKSGGKTGAGKAAKQDVDGEPLSIPALVMRKAEELVKHKAQTALAQKYESQIDADTNFIFSGEPSDESAAELAADKVENSDFTELSGDKKAKKSERIEHGFGELHQMEKQVLTQLITANKQRAKAAALKMAAAKKAAAQRLAFKKKRYELELKQEAEEKAEKLADKRAELAKREAAKEAEAAAKKAAYAKAHKPVSKMTVRQRALAFVRAFDDSFGAGGGTTLQKSRGDTALKNSDGRGSATPSLLSESASDTSSL